MNRRVFLNSIIAVLGILIIIVSFFTQPLIVFTLGMIAGMIIVLIGVSLIIKPNLRKIVIALILTVILISITYFYTTDGFGLEAEFYFNGFPFPYYQCVTSSLPNGPPSTYCNFKVGPDVFPYVWLVIDIIFWYLISSIVAWFYYKFRKPKKK